MSNIAIKAVLFASSSIAIPVLNQLLQAQQLVGVVISERLDNDSLQLQQQLEQAKIPFIRFQKEQGQQTAFQIETWQANTGLIFTFSHKLPKEIVEAFRLGLFNLHASAVPAYRGAMPLYWQIRNRESQGCLSMLRVEAEFDCGDILLQQNIPLHPLDTLNSFANTVASSSPEFVRLFLAQLADDSLVTKPQTGEGCLAQVPTQQDLLVNFETMAGEDIVAMASAGNPSFNGATLVWRQAAIGLLQATIVEHASFGVPVGTVLHIGEPEGLIVATINGALRLDILTIAEGVFTGLTFAERFGLDAGMQFDA